MTRCYIGWPKAQCLLCFGLVRALELHIGVAEDYLAVIDRVVELAQTVRTFGVLRLLSFPAALVLAEGASIRHCLTEGWKECLAQGLRCLS